MNITDINNSPKKEVDSLKEQLKDLGSSVAELTQDCIDYRAELLESYARNKVLERMNENLRSELDVTRLQHNNAIAKLEDNNIR